MLYLELHFRFSGEILRNNSVLVLEDIGENDGGLLCVSDNNEYSLVPVNRIGHDLWRNRGSTFIRLNRRITASLPAYGSYKCEVPYGQNTQRSIYISLGKFI